MKSVRFIIFFLVCCSVLLNSCKVDDDGELTVRISVSGGSGKVFARLYDSKGQLTAIENFTHAGGSGSAVMDTAKTDGTVAETGSAATIKKGSYKLYVMIEFDGDSNFSNDGKAALIDVDMLGDKTVTLGDSDFKSTVIRNVNGSTSDGHSFTTDQLYCFWMLEDTTPDFGNFNGGSIISTVFNNSVSGTSVATTGLYSTWTGLIPGHKYNVYCFVDEGGVANFPDYNQEYHGTASGVYVGGAGTTNISLKKILQ